MSSHAPSLQALFSAQALVRNNTKFMIRRQCGQQARNFREKALLFMAIRQAMQFFEDLFWKP